MLSSLWLCSSFFLYVRSLDASFCSLSAVYRKNKWDKQAEWYKNGRNVSSTLGPGISTYSPEADRQCWLSSFKTTGAGSQNKGAPGNECAVLFSLDLKYAWREVESAEVDNQWENLYNFCITEIVIQLQWCFYPVLHLVLLQQQQKKKKF